MKQQPAQFDALHNAEPLLLVLLEVLLDEPLDVLPDELLLLVLPIPEADEEAELLELASPFPPAPPEPLMPPVKPSKSSPVAHEEMSRHEREHQKIFFIWAPVGLRQC